MSTSAQDFNAQIIEGFITAHLTATVAGTSSTTARRRCSGIRLLPTPGHTRGHQSVLVDTRTVSSSSAATSRTRTTSSGRRDRGTAAGARASRSDVAHARGGGPKVPRPN